MGIDDNSIRLSPTVNPICASLSHWKATRHGYHNMQRPSFQHHEDFDSWFLSDEGRRMNWCCSLIARWSDAMHEPCHVG